MDGRTYVRGRPAASQRVRRSGHYISSKHGFFHEYEGMAVDSTAESHAFLENHHYNARGVHSLSSTCSKEYLLWLLVYLHTMQSIYRQSVISPTIPPNVTSYFHFPQTSSSTEKSYVASIGFSHRPCCCCCCCCCFRSGGTIRP